MSQNNNRDGKRDLYKSFFKCLELSFVVVISILVIVALAFIIFGSGNPANTKVGQIIKLLNDNWKALLILLIPLFYYPIRTFLGELQEIGGAKRKTPEASQPQQRPVDEKKEE